MGDPLSVLPALFAILWRDMLACLDNRVLDSGSTVWATPGVGELMTRHPVLRPATRCAWAVKRTR